MLEKINESTVIENVVDNAIKSKTDEVVVVAGFEEDRIRKVLQNRRCRLVTNEEFLTGPSTSVRKGVRSVMDRAEAVLILPGDVAFINSQSIDLVIEAYLKTKSQIVVAAHRGIPGHPILFDKSLFKDILRIDEETKGLKAVVKRHPDLILKVETGSDKVLIDIDTEEDLRRYRR